MGKNTKVKKKNIVIFSHDAGGAQILSSYLFKKNILSVYGICKGPAISIFKEKKIKVKKKTLKSLLNIGDIFFTTTSWNSILEKTAMKNLFQKRKRFITFIDHWLHFKKRFDFKYLPNEIWSFDIKSYDICKKMFRNTKIKFKKNYFHNYAVNKISQFKKNKNYKLNYLYLTEPISDLYRKFYKKNINSIEIDTINFFLKKCSPDYNITIRVHPNDNYKKYKYINKEFKNLNIRFDNKTSLYKQFALNFNIVSYQSSLLYLANKNKNRVLCSATNNKFKIHYLKNKNNYIYNYDRI